MIAVLNYLRLPRAVSAFEEEHLATMNRVGVWFYLLHVPIFTGIAWINGTGPILAAVLTTLTAVGPLVAFRVLRPRMASIVMGFTSMIMGGLLVHFGQGPLQIEMHFYFFVLLAMLSTFGNPMVILTAAATVTVHHALLWLLLPSSIFNYEASIWVVGVHALFVVLESTAACFLARKFFDNVIGLEKIIEERTAQLEARNQAVRLLLDNAGEGFLTLDAQARIAPERSVAVESWFGSIGAEESLAEVLGRIDENAAEWFELGWESLLEGMLPTEVLLEQLPQNIQIDDQHIALRYKVIEEDDGRPTKVMVVMTDVTADVERERAQSLANETAQLFQRIIADRVGFFEFYAEAGEIVRRLTDGAELPAVERRQLHTLKGNAGLYGIRSIVEVAQGLETDLEETREERLSAEQRDDLDRAWQAFRARLDQLVGGVDDDAIQIDEEEYDTLLNACERGAPHAEIAQQVRLWKLESAHRRLERIGHQAEAIARRMGKEHIEVGVDAHGIRLDSERWAPFWSAFVHAIRNAVDHGVEPIDERIRANKDEVARLSIAAAMEGDGFVLRLSDDGRGIDWGSLAAKAERLGMALPPGADETELLFLDGLSTRDEATEISGRGVGMSALRQATADLGGEVSVETSSGAGTTLRFTFPTQTVAVELPLAA